MTSEEEPVSRWSRWLANDSPFRRALTGGLMVIGCLLLAIVVARALGAAERVVITGLISLVAVVGLGLFTGNSGVVSFGHVAFMGLAAYAAGLVTIPAEIKQIALPNVPHWLASVTVGLPLAFAISIATVGLFAMCVGLPIVRLPRNGASIATLGLLIIVNALLLGLTDFTRGAQTFYGVPPGITVNVAFGVAAVIIIVARLFRESRTGIGLRASRDDELASGAMGVNTVRMRMLAWVLSAMIVAAAGVEYAQFLGAFSPKEFFFTITFTVVAMLIVGGPTTVSGAVGGAVLITFVQEIARHVEEGVSLGVVRIPAILGFQEIALGAVLLAVLYLKPEGLFGGREIDEALAERSLGWRRRPFAKAADLDRA